MVFENLGSTDTDPDMAGQSETTILKNVVHGHTEDTAL